MPEKGNQISFVKGAYAGYEGWIDISKRKKGWSQYQHVIVKLAMDKEKATRVKVSSYRVPFEEPRCFIEAAVQQHSDIELAVIRVCETFADLGLHDNLDSLKLINEELDRARNHQVNLGGKGRYRRVIWQND